MNPALAGALLALAPRCPDRCATAAGPVDVQVGGVTLPTDARVWGRVVAETADTVTIRARSARPPLAPGQAAPDLRLAVGAANLEVEAVVPRSALEERLAQPTRVGDDTGEVGVWLSGESGQVTPETAEDGSVRVQWNDWFFGSGAIPAGAFGSVYVPLPPPTPGEQVWLDGASMIAASTRGPFLARSQGTDPFPAHLLGREGDVVEVEVHTGGTRIRGFVRASQLVEAPAVETPPPPATGPVALLDGLLEAAVYGCEAGTPCEPTSPLPPVGPGGEAVTWRAGPWLGFGPKPTGRVRPGGEDVVLVSASVYDAPDGHLLASLPPAWETGAVRERVRGDWARIHVERPEVSFTGWVRADAVHEGFPGIPGPAAWVRAGSTLHGADGAAVGEVLRDTPGAVLSCDGDRAQVSFTTAWGELPLGVERSALDRPCPVGANAD